MAKADTKPTQEQAASLRREGVRYSPDRPFVVDFSNPHNPYRDLTPAEQKAADADQAAFRAAQKAADADELVMAGERAADVIGTQGA